MNARLGDANEVIRPVEISDLNDLAANCFPQLDLKDVEERVREDIALHEARQGVSLVAVMNGRAGVFGKLLTHGDTGWLFDIAAGPEFRGQGAVQRLLARLADEARIIGVQRLLLHVRADNHRARRAYEKAGFKHVGQDGMRGEQLRYEKKLDV